MKTTNSLPDSNPNQAKMRGLQATVIVCLVMITATLVGGYITQQAMTARQERFFGRQADQIGNTLYSNIYTHVTVLEGFRGLFNARGSFNHQSFITYINSLNIDNTYQAGVSSFFYIPEIDLAKKKAHEQAVQREPNIPLPYQTFNIHPTSSLAKLYPTTYVEPIKGRESSLGLDFGTFADRLSAITYARDNNTLATTQPLILISTGKPGFFFFLPLYEPKQPIDTLGEKRSAFRGVVGAAFRAESAYTQVFGNLDPYPYLDFQIYQGDAISSDRLLHDHDPSYTAIHPRFETKRMIRIHDQTWTVLVQTKPDFSLGDQEERLPVIIFIVGLGITTLVLVVFLIRLLIFTRQHRL